MHRAPALRRPRRRPPRTLPGRPLVAAALLLVLGSAGQAAAAPSAVALTRAPVAWSAPTAAVRSTSTVVTGPVERVCAAPAPGSATCLAERMSQSSTWYGLPAVRSHQPGVSSPAVLPGRTPVDIQSAYGLTGRSASGRTVAIVDAYGYPNAERDLGVYRSQFGLPACTKANGCLTILSESGSTTGLPALNLGWAGEQALDLDAVSAACPSCKILLVQAKSASFADLGASVNTAAAQRGVVAISNSYGGGDAADSRNGAPYHHPGIAVTASTGDSGYAGASYPASSQWVVAVGGTTLTPAPTTARGWTETAWSGSGSGCSSLNQAPVGQTQAMTRCTGRAMADVSAVADPRTGLAVYAPTSSTGAGWGQYGGTSLASPLVAAAFALSGNTTGEAATIPYAHQGAFNDITSGANGSCATMCKTAKGWDGPTGLGSPNGVAGL